MLFTSLEFFVFLPLALLVFAVLPAAAAMDLAAAGELRLLRRCGNRSTSSISAR